MAENIEEYILKELKRGFSEEEIRKALKKRGYSGNAIKSYFDKIDNRKNRENFFDIRELALLLLGCVFFILLATTKFNFLVWISLVPYLIVTYKKPTRKIIFYSIIMGVLSSTGLFFWVFMYKYYWFLLAMLLFSFFFTIFGLTINFIYKKDEKFYFIAPAFIWTAFILFFSMTRLGGYWIELSVFHTSNYLLAIIGSIGLTFLIVLVNSLSAFFIIKKESKLLITLLIISIILFSGWLYHLNFKPSGEKLRIALLQPNVQMLWQERQGKTGEVFGILEQSTLKAAETKPDIIVWPEYAINVYIPTWENGTYLNKTRELAKKTGAMLVIGSLSFPFAEFKNHYDSAFIFSPGGELVGRYDSVAPALYNSFAIPSPTKELPVFELKRKRFGIVMCYEETLNWVSQKYAKENADFLISLTDNQDIFANGISLASLFSRLRAAENNIYIFRDGSVGITQIIYPNGRTKSKLDPFKQGILVEDVYVNSGRTFYSQNGNLIIWLAVLSYFAYLLFLVFNKNFGKNPENNNTKNSERKRKKQFIFLLYLFLAIIFSTAVYAGGGGKKGGGGGGCNDACCAGFPSKEMGKFCAINDDGNYEFNKMHLLFWECSAQSVHDTVLESPGECQYCKPIKPSALCYIPISFIRDFSNARSAYQSGWTGSSCEQLYAQLCDPVKNKIDAEKCKTDSAYKCSCDIDLSKYPECADFNKQITCSGIYYSEGQADWANFGSEKSCTAQCPSGTIYGDVTPYKDAQNPTKYKQGQAPGTCNANSGSCDVYNCKEANCVDEVDNDGDGKTDSADPDCQTKEACAYSSLSYNAKGNKIQCCGANKEKDSGYLTESADFVCAKSPECSTPDQFCWLDSIEKRGNVYSIKGSDFDIIAEGGIWHACDALGDGTANFESPPGKVLKAGQIVTANSDDFICNLENSRESFAECCGNSDCKNLGTSGTKHITGDKLSIAGATYYCTQRGEWTTDLDKLTYQQECEASGYFFTGTQCCGDGSPANKAIKSEYYNDLWVDVNPNYLDGGGCFNSIKIINNTLISDANAVLKGTFDTAEFIDGKNKEWASFNKGRSQISVFNSQLIIYGDSSTLSRGVSQDISNRVRQGAVYLLQASVNPRALSTGYVEVDIYSPATNYQQIALMIPAGAPSKTYSAKISIPSDTRNLQLRIFTWNFATGSALIDNINLTIAEKNIINFDGEFYSCNLQDANTDGYADNYVSTNTGISNLAKNSAFCEAKGNFYCSFTNTWESSQFLNETNEIETVNSSKSLPGQTSSVACCPHSRCWDGKNCVQNQAYDYSGQPIVYSGSEYRCINGNWKPAVRKFNWDYSKTGFCPETKQCLSDPEKNYCVNNNEYVADHYCDNGNWTSRTKFVATQLLSLAEGDYTIYCDEYQNALAFYNYQIPLSAGPFVSEFIQSGTTCFDSQKNPVPCVNNFCILKDSKKTVFGTSLNQPINSKELPFAQALGNIVCEDAYYFNDNNYHKCVTGQKILWYNNKSMSVIFGNQSIEKETIENDYPAIFAAYLKSPIAVMAKTIVETIRPRQKSGPYFFYDFINNTNDFNKLYLAKKGSREIIGILETKGTGNINDKPGTYLAVRYSGFDVDICKSANIYDSKIIFVDKAGEGLFYCQNVNGRYYVVTRDDGRGSAGGLIAWQELTSKTRLN